VKVGDVIKMVAPPWPGHQDVTGLLIRISERHNGRRMVATVLISQGLVTWPLDMDYEYEVVHEGG
jgi:hypothetical protein